MSRDTSHTNTTATSRGRAAWDGVVEASKNWETSGWHGGARLRAALSILRVEELIRTANSQIMKPFNLTHSRHEALALLFFSRNGELTLSDLGRRLVLHPTSITSTVDSLEDLGYVVRTPHPTDRRATMARITEAGRAVFARSSEGMLDLQFSLSALTEAEAEQLFRLLRKVRSAAGDLVESTS